MCDPGRISFRREPPSEEDDDASSPTPRRDSPCASSSLSLSSHLVHACPIPASPHPFTADSPSPVRANVRAPRCAGPSSRPVPAIAGGVFSLRQSPRWSRSPRRGRPRCSLLCTLAQSRNAPWVVLWAGASLVPPPLLRGLDRGRARWCARSAFSLSPSNLFLPGACPPSIPFQPGPIRQKRTPPARLI